MFSWDFFREMFKNTFLTKHLRMTASYIYLWTLRSFSKRLFIEHLWGTVLIHVKVGGFQVAYTIKNYFTSAFQTFSARTRSSHSKVFIYLKSPKIIFEEVNS